MKNSKGIHNIYFAVILLLISAPTFSSQQGEYATLKMENQQTFRVYAAGSVDASQGILLIHGWLGLNQGIEALARKFATALYVGCF